MRKSVLILGVVYLMVWALPQICSAEIDPETAIGVWLFDEGAGKTTKDASGNGLAKALGGLDVEPMDKLAVTWGGIKANR